MLFGDPITRKHKKNFSKSFNVLENCHLVVKHIHFSNMNILTTSYWISIKFSSNVSKHLKKRPEEKCLNILNFLEKFLCLCSFFKISDHPDIKKIHGEQVTIKIKKKPRLGALYDCISYQC